MLTSAWRADTGPTQARQKGGTSQRQTLLSVFCQGTVDAVPDRPSPPVHRRDPCPSQAFVGSVSSDLGTKSRGGGPRAPRTQGASSRFFAAVGDSEIGTLAEIFRDP